MLLKLNVTGLTSIPSPIYCPIYPSTPLSILPLGKLTNGKQQVKLAKREFQPLEYWLRYSRQG